VISAHGNFQSVRAGVTLHEPVALPHNVRVTDEDGDDANLMDSEDETPKNRPVDPLENDVSLTLNLTPGEQINISIDVQAPLP
jgi:translation elongation factor P/translation initiation factor 5A